MKHIILICTLFLSLTASAQFPTRDSLRIYVNKWVRNSAVESFTNLRLNLSLNGMISFLDSVGAGGTTNNSSVGSAFKLAVPGTRNIKSLSSGWGVSLDSATTGQVNVKIDSATVLNARRKVDTAYATNDTTLRITINGTARDVIIKGKGGSGTPGGSSSQIQYNNSGAFGGSANLTWDNTNRNIFIDKGSSDTAAITFDGSYTGTKPILTIRPPVKNDSTVEYNMWSSLSANSDNTRSNHILILGSNYTGKKSTIPRAWDAWESNWYSSGSRYIERHYELYHPTSGNVRLSSSTAIIGNNLTNSTNQWDFRANVFQLSDLNNIGYFAVSKANSGGSNAFAQAVLAGGTPILRIQDAPTGVNFDIQNDGNGGNINAGGLAIGSTYAGSNLFLKHIGSTTGNANMAYAWSSGNLVYTIAYGSGVTNNRANTFAHYDQTQDKHFLKYFNTTGNTIIGNGNGADHGETVQLQGSTYINGKINQTKDSLAIVSSTTGTSVVVYDTVSNIYKRVAPSVFNSVSGGTYTPTVSSKTNTDTVKVYTTYYTNVGGYVTVWGYLKVDATSAAATSFIISLPVSSSSSNKASLAGTAVSSTTQQSMSILHSTTTSGAKFAADLSSTAELEYSFHFTYYVDSSN